MLNTPQPQGAAGQVSPYAFFVYPLSLLYLFGGGYIYWLVHHSREWSPLVPFPSQIGLGFLAFGVLFALFALWRGIRLLLDVRNWLGCKASLERADSNFKKHNNRRSAHQHEQMPPEHREWYDRERKRYSALKQHITVESVEVGMSLGVVLAALYAVTVCYAAFYVEGGWQCGEGKPIRHMILPSQYYSPGQGYLPIAEDNTCADLAPWHLYVPAGLKGEK